MHDVAILPLSVYSDNGRNFLGASRALKDAYNFITTASIRKHLINFTSTQTVEWNKLKYEILGDSVEGK